MVEVAVPADPAKRGARVVLARFGPAGEPGHVRPGAAGAGLDVDGQAERVLAEGLVADGSEALGDPDVVAADQVEHVVEDAPVNARPGLARDRHPAAASRDPHEPTDLARRPVVHALAAQVEGVQSLRGHAVAARAAPGAVRDTVAQVDRVVARAAVREVGAAAANELVGAVAAEYPGRELGLDANRVIEVARVHLDAGHGRSSGGCRTFSAAVGGARASRPRAERRAGVGDGHRAAGRELGDRELIGLAGRRDHPQRRAVDRHRGGLRAGRCQQQQSDAQRRCSATSQVHSSTTLPSGSVT